MSETIEGLDWTERILSVLRTERADPTVTTKLDAEGPFLAQLGAAVQGIAEQYMGCTIGFADHAVALDGDDTDTLYLPDAPIVSITSVSVDGTALTVDDPLVAPVYPPTADVVITDTQQAIQRIDGDVFTEGTRNVLVSYRSGLDPAKNEGLISALAFWGAYLYKRKDTLGISSRTVGDITTTFADKPPAIVQQAMDMYRRVFVP